MALHMPLIQALRNYIDENPEPFHMPGHKGGKGFSSVFTENILKMDVTEVPGLDNLHAPEDVLREAQVLAADVFGSDVCLFLVNGSTAGIHAMVHTAAGPGEKLLIPRNCHKAVWDALVFSGAEPVYINPQVDEAQEIATQIMPQQVHQALLAYPKVKGLLMVHPNYYGMCADIESIRGILSAKDKLLLVDEAHGAHFKFHPALPLSSSEVKADIWVQSAHKTLPALTQAAYLHAKGSSACEGRLFRAVSAMQSTSPSYLLMASLDYARAYMESEGYQRLDDLICSLAWTRNALKNLGMDAWTEYNKGSVHHTDVTRLVIDVSPFGFTGYEGEAFLRSRGIQVEMSDWRRIVLICTVSDTSSSFERLVSACGALVQARKPANKKRLWTMTPEIPNQMISPREAFYLPSDKVEMEKTAGRICAGLVGAYPPGIPQYCPGEWIDEAGIEALIEMKARGGRLFGVDEAGRIPVIR